MSEPPIYLDHHATTPCDSRVIEEMLPFFTTTFGNPSSLTHDYGRKAANAVEDSRIAIARFFAVQPNEIYFTAGATESNNIALNLLAPGDHLITCAIEHRSVLGPARRLEARGVELTILQPDREGLIDPDALRAAIGPKTRLVSIEAANGEIGTVQRMAEFGVICRERGVIYHSDITQAAGKIALSLANVDLASFSAHKLYGPKGIGGLIVRRGMRVEPLVIGGGQERNVRPGTVNVPGVVGMAAAFRIRADEMREEGRRLTALRNDLWARLTSEIAGVSVNGPRELRLPGNLNVSFDGIEADSLIVAVRRFALSSGTAGTLTAVGLSEAAARSSIRLGLGRSNTAAHVEMLVDDCKRVVAKLREKTSAA